MSDQFQPPPPPEGQPPQGFQPPPAGFQPPPPPGFQPPPPGYQQGYPPAAPPGYQQGYPPAGYPAPGSAMVQLPPGVVVATTGRRIGAYFLAIPLFIVTLGIGYLIWGLMLWNKEGTTPALKVLGMKCWDIQTNRPPTFGQMAMRDLVGRIVEGLCILIGIYSFVIFLGDERRTLHDKIGRTIVVHDPNKVLG